MITMKFEANNAEELKQLILDAAGSLAGMKADEIESAEVSTVQKSAAVTSDTKETKAEQDIPSIEEIRAKAQALGAGKKAEIKALLDEFGAKNLSTLPENRRAEFLARLEEL